MAKSSSDFKSFEIERCVLSVIFKDSLWLSEIKDKIKTEFFAYPPNQRVYAAICILFSETGGVDSHILINRLKIIGINQVDGLGIEDYILSISSMSINLDSKISYLEELSKFYYCRKTYSALGDAQKFISDNLELPLQEIISGTEKRSVDAITFSAVSGDDSKMVDLYGSGRQYVDEAVKNKGKNGLASPFPRFNEIFGNFYTGGLFVFAARSKVGKSTMLSFLANYFVETGEGRIKICFCDTEMMPEEVYFRNLSAISGVEEIDIREGTFSESPEMVKKVTAGIEKFEKYDESIFYHVYVPNSPIDEVESVVRRWHSKHVKEGDIAVVIYDYCKMTNETGGNNEQEYQIMGQKASKLKAIANCLPNTMVISAVQLNEQDGVSQSARIKWSVDALWILQKKTLEDYGTFGKKWGTHFLYPVVTRKVGRKYKEFGPVKVMVGNKEEYRSPHINLNIDRFVIEERGTLEEAIRDVGQAGQLTPRQSSSDKNSQTYKKYSQQ